MVQYKHVNFTKSLLIILGYFLAYLEIFKYNGFIEAHTGLAASVFLSLLVVGIFFCHSAKRSLFNKILVILNSLIWIILPIIESRNYDNYVFTKFHIHPELLPIAIIFGLSISIVELTPNFRRTISRLKSFSLTSPRNTINVVLSVIIIGLTLNYLGKNLLVTSKMAGGFNRMMLQQPSADRSSKMRSIWGVTYDFAEFIKTNTPDDARIAVPPRSNEYPTVGNIQLFRYFVYPRRVVNMEDGNKEVLPDIDYEYVVIAKNFQPTETDSFWPSFQVSSTAVLIFDPSDNSTTIMPNTNYMPESHGNLTNWGLIKVGD